MQRKNSKLIKRFGARRHVRFRQGRKRNGHRRSRFDVPRWTPADGASASGD